MDSHLGGFRVIPHLSGERLLDFRRGSRLCLLYFLCLFERLSKPIPCLGSTKQIQFFSSRFWAPGRLPISVWWARGGSVRLGDLAFAASLQSEQFQGIQAVPTHGVAEFDEQTT